MCPAGCWRTLTVTLVDRGRHCRRGGHQVVTATSSRRGPGSARTSSRSLDRSRRRGRRSCSGAPIPTTLRIEVPVRVTSGRLLRPKVNGDGTLPERARNDASVRCLWSRAWLGCSGEHRSGPDRTGVARPRSS